MLPSVVLIFIIIHQQSENANMLEFSFMYFDEEELSAMDSSGSPTEWVGRPDLEWTSYNCMTVECRLSSKENSMSNVQKYRLN